MAILDHTNDQDIASKIAAYLQAHAETGFFIGSVLIACAGEVLMSQG